MKKKDPESTRCTFVVSVAERGPFVAGVPGDRLELYEQRDGMATGRVIVARVLDVSQFRHDLLPH